MYVSTGPSSACYARRQTSTCLSFLTVFLGEKVTILEILESESNQLSAEDKFNRVDIKARNSKDEIIIIEIQNTRELYYLERILYGVAKAITEHISLGETYYKVKKIYSISVLYFDIGKGNDYLYYGQNHFVGVHTSRPDTTAPGLSEAREKLKYFSMPPKERMAYDEHLSAVMIQNDVLDSAKLEGKIEGRAEGRDEERFSIARNMKQLGIPVDVIVKSTGLTSGEIETL